MPEKPDYLGQLYKLNDDDKSKRIEYEARQRAKFASETISSRDLENSRTLVELVDEQSRASFLEAAELQNKVLLQALDKMDMNPEAALPGKINELVNRYREDRESFDKRVEKSGRGLIGWAMRETYQKAADELGISFDDIKGSRKEALIAEAHAGSPERKKQIFKILEDQLIVMLSDERFTGNETLQNMLIAQVNNLKQEFYPDTPVESPGIDLVEEVTEDDVLHEEAIIAGDQKEVVSEVYDADDGTVEEIIEIPIEKYEAPIDLRAPETTEALFNPLKEGLTASRERYEAEYNALPESDRKHIHLAALYELHEKIAAGLAFDFNTSSIRPRFEAIAARIESQPTITPQL